MGSPRSLVLLACVCALLVVVAASAESAKVTGFDYEGFSIAGVLKGLGYNQTAGGGQGGSTVVTTTTSARAGSGGSSSQTSGPLPSVPSLGVSVPAWVTVALALAGLGGALLLVLTRTASPTVVSLEETLDEMERERRRVEETTTYRLRNSALLRYYTLMRRACVEIGLRDGPSETPLEYVRRVAATFGLDESEAAEFASAVNRARYGEELTEEEAREASRFMGVFAETVRGRAGKAA